MQHAKRFMNPKALAFSALALFAFALPAVRGSDIAKFPTDKEAVDHYLDEIQKRKPASFMEYIDVVGLDAKDRTVADKFKPLMWVIDPVIKSAGAFRSVKVIRVLKFGPMVRHAQYLVTYEKNVMALDVWLVDSTQGWQLVKFNFPIGNDVGASLAKVPAEFQSVAEGF